MAEAKPPLDPESRAAIKERKGKIVKLEDRNYSSLIVWHTNGTWWKMCGHSALIYAHHVAPKLLDKKNVQIRIDTDRYHISYDGVVSIRDIEKFKAEVVAAGLIFSLQHSSQQVIFFGLPKRVTPEDIEDFRNEEKGNRQKINEVLRVKINDQYLENEINKATKNIYFLVRKLDEKRYTFIGQDLYRHTISIYRLKTHLNCGHLDLTTAYRKMLQHINDINTLVGIGYEMAFFSTDRLSILVQHLNNIRVALESGIKKAEKKAEQTKD